MMEYMLFILWIFFCWSCMQSNQQAYRTPPQGMVYVPVGDNIKDFFIDISPVTVAEFDEFVK